MSIWEACEGQKHLGLLEEEPWRVVEAQHILNSRDLVDDIEEYEVLEDLLEQSKPELSVATPNPLIFTPFRYPPLDYGSRFGRVFEPSLWYGSLNINTALTEVAYYRLKFNQDTEADLGYVETLLTAFNVFIKTNRGINLTEPPFAAYRTDISSKNSYDASQQLGSDMRANQVDAFVFYSARCSIEDSKNIAIYETPVFHHKQGQYTYNQQTWKCVASNIKAEMTRTDALGKHQALTFAWDSFSKKL
jgi:hypothetical protein